MTLAYCIQMFFSAQQQHGEKLIIVRDHADDHMMVIVKEADRVIFSYAAPSLAEAEQIANSFGAVANGWGDGWEDTGGC
jgi:hypothetical protein